MRWCAMLIWHWLHRRSLTQFGNYISTQRGCCQHLATSFGLVILANLKAFNQPWAIPNVRKKFFFDNTMFLWKSFKIVLVSIDISYKWCKLNVMWQDNIKINLLLLLKSLGGLVAELLTGPMQRTASVWPLNFIQHVAIQYILVRWLFSSAFSSTMNWRNFAHIDLFLAPQ